MAKATPVPSAAKPPVGYAAVHGGIVDVLQTARTHAVRSVNAWMTASYWELGRRVVEAEQKGKRRADYGDQLLKRLSLDLTGAFGRGFGVVNLQQMRNFYLVWPLAEIYQTPSDTSRTPPAAGLASIAQHFPLPWSAYVRLLSVKNAFARQFYEAEALRGGWSVRQIDRQINSQFFERTSLSRNQAAMLTKGAIAIPEDAVTPESAIKDPFVLEFLGLKDEYSETALEAALIHRLEDFLLELGDDFAFVGRQKRLRLDDMHTYLNYAKAHWMREGENPPVGLILCQQKGAAEAHYALEGLGNKVLAAEYQTILPSESVMAEALARTTRLLESRSQHLSP
ncbi:MAG: PDDEXK nuclease domain-containing protein [Rhodoferax sp.]|uniref:PDDEXK nuclease domain-containing protein n=1 Tax=Rhodoferax sp. TaxID=50421 RepID=UPI003262F891